jgi:hypothetical protein
MTDTEWLQAHGFPEADPGWEWNTPEVRVLRLPSGPPELRWAARALDDIIAPHVPTGRGATPALALIHLMEHVQEYEVRCLQEATQKLQAVSKLRSALTPSLPSEEVARL